LIGEVKMHLHGTVLWLVSRNEERRRWQCDDPGSKCKSGAVGPSGSAPDHMHSPTWRPRGPHGASPSGSAAVIQARFAFPTLYSDSIEVRGTGPVCRRGGYGNAASFGGHYSCPNRQRKRQRPEGGSGSCGGSRTEGVRIFGTTAGRPRRNIMHLHAFLRVFCMPRWSN
jgi:hypothetical protein